MFPFFRLGLSQRLNPTQEEARLVAVFKARNKVDKTHNPSVEYYPEHTHGIVLVGKRTRARQGSIAYIIGMIGNSVYKISADCITIVETE